MSQFISNKILIILLGVSAFYILTANRSTAIAQNIPGPADVGRIRLAPEEILPPRERPQIVLPEINALETPLPEGASEITFMLENVLIQGMSAFTSQEIEDIYKPFIGEEIPVSYIWEFSRQITERYQNRGYFLSRSYVPAQEIDSGIITLRIIEGYIADTNIIAAEENYLVRLFKRRIMAQRPIKLSALEQELLLLNDIPGKNFKAVLGQVNDSDSEGEVQLTLMEEKSKGRSTILFNNHGSRFSGPHRNSFAHENSFLKNQRTIVSGTVSALPIGDELWAVSATHEVKFLPTLGFKISLGRTVSEPGFTLSSSEIKSRSVNLGAELEWQIIRQRHQNMSLSLGVDSQNIKTDILGTPLTRDRIRALRLNGSYTGLDPLNGYNSLNMSLSRGIPGRLGASEPGELNLSRARAKPDFTKFEASWQRSQFIAPNWLGISSITGQRASKALYSSEEFGFGGPFLGRAYDTSEITGDHGIGGALELQYLGLKPLYQFKFSPSIFYEIGKVCNIDDGQKNYLSLADAGIGLNFSHPSGFSGSITLAQPLTKSINTPTYGNNGKNPKIFFRLGWQF